MSNFCKFIFLVLMVGVGYNEAELTPPLTDRYTMAETCQGLLTEQVGREVYAELLYLKLGACFARNNIARDGISKFFYKSAKEEADHARIIIDYLAKRGSMIGDFEIKELSSPCPDVLGAFQQALRLEKEYLAEFHKIHTQADSECKDPHLMDLIENEFFEEQIKSIDFITRIIGKLSAMNNGMGEYLIDKELGEASE